MPVSDEPVPPGSAAAGVSGVPKELGAGAMPGAGVARKTPGVDGELGELGTRSVPGAGVAQTGAKAPESSGPAAVRRAGVAGQVRGGAGALESAEAHEAAEEPDAAAVPEAPRAGGAGDVPGAAGAAEPAGAGTTPKVAAGVPGVAGVSVGEDEAVDLGWMPPSPLLKLLRVDGRHLLESLFPAVGPDGVVDVEAGWPEWLPTSVRLDMEEAAWRAANRDQDSAEYAASSDSDCADHSVVADHAAGPDRGDAAGHAADADHAAGPDEGDAARHAADPDHAGVFGGAGARDQIGVEGQEDAAALPVQARSARAAGEGGEAVEGAGGGGSGEGPVRPGGKEWRAEGVDRESPEYREWVWQRRDARVVTDEEEARFFLDQIELAHAGVSALMARVFHAAWRLSLNPAMARVRPGRPVGVKVDPEDITAFEIHARLAIPYATALSWVRAGRSYATATQLVGVALASGAIPPTKAAAITGAMGKVDVDQAGIIERAVLPEAHRLVPRSLERLTARAVVEVDPQAAAEREAWARRERHVTKPRLVGDGMARVSALLPALDAQRVWQVVNHAAVVTKQAGDPRSLPNLRADALTQFITNTCAHATDDGDTPGPGAQHTTARNGTGPDAAPTHPDGRASATPDSGMPEPAAPGRAEPDSRLPDEVGAGGVAHGRGGFDHTDATPTHAETPAHPPGSPGVPPADRGPQGGVPDATRPQIPTPGADAAPGTSVPGGQMPDAAVPGGAPPQPGAKTGPPGDGPGRGRGIPDGEVPGVPAGEVPGERGSVFDRVHSAVTVVVPLATVLGHSQRPGHVAGLGPISATAVRETMTQLTTRVRYLVTTAGEQDPMREQLVKAIAISPGTYQIPPALKALIQHMLDTCDNYLCPIAAADSDVEHHQPFAQGGPSVIENLGCACRRDHILKTFTPIQFGREPDGRKWLTTVLGHTYTEPDPPPF